MAEPADQLDLINPNLLTPVARQLVALIGIEQMIALCKKRGGFDLYIPKQGESSLLSEILTPQSLTALAQSELAGKYTYLPKADRALQQLRNIAICAARETHSGSTVSTAFNLTRRQVNNIMSKKREEAREKSDDPNVEMFGDE